MAVELAKVALWLHSFTVGAPLSFLDHHLRCGDSIVGNWIAPSLVKLNQLGALHARDLIGRVERVSELMSAIEDITDNDLTEAQTSKENYETFKQATDPVAAFLSLMTAETVMGVLAAAPRKAPEPIDRLIQAGKSDAAIRKAEADHRAFDRAAGFRMAVAGELGDPAKIASGALLIAETKNGGAPLPGSDTARRHAADQVVTEARALAKRHRFFHWEIGFPHIWTQLLSSHPGGGFDAVIGNPPYVRQELLGEIKPALKQAYDSFDGMADLYVYFYEQGLKLLRPGGRLSFVVTNKWLKAGYAENLRGLFTNPARANLQFIADFGHAKHFFPDADVFPCVVVVGKPVTPDAADPALQPTAEICVIPRDQVPRKGLSAAVAEASYPLPLAAFSKASWTLEPPAVMALLEKIRRNGVPLAEYAGVRPLYGIKTGLNEAFLIDGATRDRLVRDDPACADIIKPYLRGQDIQRWYSPDSGLFMILLKSSSDHPWPWADAASEGIAEAIFRQTYPSLHRHMKQYEIIDEPGAARRRGLRFREDHGRFWWELRPCAYYDLFEGPKIFYQAIQFYPNYSLQSQTILGNNKTYFIPSNDIQILITLNSPTSWYFSWRHFIHMKDEALSNDQVKINQFPIPSLPASEATASLEWVHSITESSHSLSRASAAVTDWLRHEFGVEKPGRALTEPHKLDADGFIAAVRAALPKRRKLSAAEIARLRQEWVDTLTPARQAAATILRCEQQLSDLVNQAYGLTPEEVRLMWQTAPPRMPLDPQDELRRLGFTD
jgi:hypothetical protein